MDMAKMTAEDWAAVEEKYLGATTASTRKLTAEEAVLERYLAMSVEERNAQPDILTNQGSDAENAAYQAASLADQLILAMGGFARIWETSLVSAVYWDFASGAFLALLKTPAWNEAMEALKLLETIHGLWEEAKCALEAAD